jgi:hypothetical protein
MTANVQEAVLSNSTVGRNDRGSAEKKYMEPPEVELDEGKAANSEAHHTQLAAVSSERSSNAKPTIPSECATSGCHECSPKLDLVDSKLTPRGEEASFLAGMQRAFGARDADLIMHLFLQATSVRPESMPEHAKRENSVLAALHGIEPRDELEGLLAVQMVAVHNLAMAFLKRASLEAQTTPGIDLNVNRGTKLLRTFAALMEAPHRHRSKGEQKMIVEHVHVHNGGQAIVGPVNQSRTRQGKETDGSDR